MNRGILQTLPRHSISHTAECYTEEILSVCESWKLPLNSVPNGTPPPEWYLPVVPSIMSITTDNEAATIRGTLDSGGFRQPCLAHSLQLCLGEVFDHRGIKEPLTAAQDLSTSLRSSPRMDRLLNRACLFVKIPYKRPQSFSRTRWTSMHSMLTTLLHLKSALLVMNDVEDIQEQARKLDWNTIESVAELLQRIDIATSLLGADTKVTISMVIFMIDTLNISLEPQLGDCGQLTELRCSLLNAVEARFGIVMNPQPKKRQPLDPSCPGFHQRRKKRREKEKVEIDRHRHLRNIWSLATLLDPRFKLFNWPSHSGVCLDHIKAIAEDLLEKIIASGEIPTAEPQRMAADVAADPADRQERQRNALTSFLRTAATSTKQISVKQEITNYLSAPPLTPQEVVQKADGSTEERWNDPLKWWASHCDSYPRVAKVARSILGIPATSVSSERVFSKAGLLLSNRRLNLKASRVDELLSLNANWSNPDVLEGAVTTLLEKEREKDAPLH